MKRAGILLVVLLTVALYGCGSGGSTPPPSSTPTAPAITVPPASQTVTAGQTASFTVTATGTSPLSYQWNRNGTAISGATTSTYSMSATMADSGATFTVTVSNSVGTVTSNAATLTVNAAAPAISTHPASQSVTTGQTATFSVVATGTAPLTYQWKKNGTAISGATASTYTTPATTAADNGATFTVTVTNSAGNVTSNAATLTVNTPPSITAQPGNQAVLEGQTASFSVTATGTAPLSYQWKKNGAAISGATASSYTTAATVMADSGASYTVTVTNVAGSVTSSAAALTVNPAPPAITTQPVSNTVLEGQTASFSIAATGTAPLSYQWSKNGTAIAGATASSYTTPATVLADSGASFAVTVTNAAGNVTSNTATLTVNPAPPAITTQPSNQTVLAGQTASFSVTATGSATLSYQWKKNGTAIGGATSSSYTTPATVLGDSGATFTVTVTNSAGNVTSSAATLTVNAPPAITAQPAGQTVLDGQTASFSVTATGTTPLTYQWSKNGTAIGGATGASYTTPAAVMADSGATFSVTVTNAFGNVTSTAATLTVNPAPPAITTQPVNQAVTDGQTASFSVVATGTAPLSYQWNKNGTPIGGATSNSYTTPATVMADSGASFTVTVTNAAGNVTSNAATLTVNAAPPVFTTQPANQSVLVGQTATFSVVLTGTSPLGYQWSKNGTTIPGATASSYTTPATVLGDNGATFTVTVTNSAGNVTSSAATLTVNAPPAITAQPGNQTVLEGQTATFSVTATGTAPLAYQWSKNGTAIGGATASSYTTPATVLADSGATFTVTITNAFGNATSSAASLTVNPAPPAITTQPSNQAVLAGQTATFSVTATGTAPLSYQWSKNGAAIGGATASSYTTPATVQADNGATFTVTVTNAAGNVTSNPATLSVNAAPAITSQPGNQAVTEGQTATFSVTASGTAPLTYQWSKNGTAIGGATASSYTTPATAVADNGSTFTVTVTNAFGNITSNAATLTVNPAPPIITTQPADQTVFATQTATFSVSATSSAPLSYQWNRNGAAIPGANASSYTTAPLTVAGDNGALFTVTVSNAGGSVTSTSATLTVNPLPAAPLITAQPGNQTVFAGQTATFSVTATGTGTLTYQWSKNGTVIGGATGSSYTTPSTTVSDNGSTFTVAVTNLGGTTTSNPATLTVNANSFQVSGQINWANGGPTGVAGVTVSIDTTPVQTTTTDNNGGFSFSNVPNGTYTITPTITGPSSAFYPTSQQVTVSGGNVFSINFQAALGYTVSGTVSYAGAKTGRIYISLTGGNNGYALGTSIATPADPFTIRGVTPGTYVLQAWRDNLGFGVRNASNPTGNIAVVTVSNANVPGQVVTLTDPATPDLSAKSSKINTLSPMDSGVVLQIKPIVDLTGLELATRYNVEWSSSNTFSPLAGSTTLAAMGGDDPYILHGLSGLTNGASLYFRVQGQAGASTSLWTTSLAPVTIGAPSGGNLVSGTVTFSGTATGPLYVGFYDMNTGAVYAATIANPVSPQAYNVSVPTGSNYFHFGIIDQNNNGLIDAGDISNTGQGGETSTAISGPLVNQDLTLPSADSTARVTTNHSQTMGQAGDWYGLNFDVRAGIKRPVAVALVSGPNLATPIDIAPQSGRSGQFQFWPNTAGVRPNVGDNYQFDVLYSDGNPGTLNTAVSAVLDAFASNLSPSGSVPGDTTPTFTWTDPTSASSYIYGFDLWDSNFNTIWHLPNNTNGFPSTITSVTWGTDPTGGGSLPSVPSLTGGVTYQWMIRVSDVNGNSSQMQTSFTP